MPKKTWDEKYRIWIDRIYPGWVKLDGSIPLWVVNDAYEAGRRHQRQVCNEDTAKLTMKLKALLRETLESSDALTVNSNRLEAENKALKMAKNSLSIEYHAVVNSRYQLIDDIWELEAKLAKKWWQFWRKA